MHNFCFHVILFSAVLPTPNPPQLEACDFLWEYEVERCLLFHSVTVTRSSKRLLNTNRKIEVLKASKEGKLTIKQIMTKHIGKTQVNGILKARSKIKSNG
jgi:hypothetical protein